MKIGRVTDDTLALFARVWREQISRYLPQMAMILALVVVIAATTSFYPLLIKAAFDAFADPLAAESTGFVRRMERLVSKSINYDIGVINAVATVVVIVTAIKGFSLLAQWGDALSAHYLPAHPPVGLVVASILNVHHYFVDGSIWKLSSKEVRQDLFAHLPARA